MLDEV